ncbi:hypothetical protein [Paenibacillus sp. 32O-W]|uniref:hypothetical protein n=1 Tax=Paenibacillus sp. 32O-W TaxID=1695218 RepID=UPI0011A44808|nr:hypothetical protein [Paenibacillus sp. 32O-W]
MLSGNNLKGIVGMAVIGVLSVFVVFSSTTSAFNSFTVSSEKPEAIQELSTNAGTKLFVENNKIMRSYGVNSDANGTKAVVMNKTNDKLSIVDNKGMVLDDLADLHKKMEEVRVNKENEKHVGNVIGAGHLLDNTLFFASNYDSKDWKNSIWSMDLESRDVKKILSAEQYGNLSFISVSDDRILLESDKEISKATLVLEISQNGAVTEHIIPGLVIKASPNGANITYRVYEDEGLLANKLGIYSVIENKSQQIEGIPDNHLFNNYGAWNNSGTKYAFLSIYLENTQERHILMVYDLTEESLIQINEPKNGTFQAGQDNLLFENDSVIKVPLVNNQFVSVSLH